MSVGCKQRKWGILDSQWSRNNHAAFSQAKGHQVETVGDETESNRGGKLVHPTNKKERSEVAGEGSRTP